MFLICICLLRGVLVLCDRRTPELFADETEDRLSEEPVESVAEKIAQKLLDSGIIVCIDDYLQVAMSLFL